MSGRVDMILHLLDGETFLFHWKFRSQHLQLGHLRLADPVSLGHVSPGPGSITDVSNHLHLYSFTASSGS